MLKRIKVAVSIALLCGALVWLVVETSGRISFADFRGLPITALAICFAALIVSNLVAIARMRFVAAALGYRIPWGDSAAALSVGALGGAIFFQIAGQIIGRNIILARRSVPPSVIVLITTMSGPSRYLFHFRWPSSAYG